MGDALPRIQFFGEQQADAAAGDDAVAGVFEGALFGVEFLLSFEVAASTNPTTRRRANHSFETPASAVFCRILRKSASKWPPLACQLTLIARPP